jgi:acyl-CoA oxidase
VKITSSDRLDGGLDGGVASTTCEHESDVAQRTSSDALSLVLRGRQLDDFETRLIEVLHHEIFKPREGLSSTQACQLSYARARYLQRTLGLKAQDLLGNLEHLLVLHGWCGTVDGTLLTLLTIHFNLCIGSILQQGEGRAELLPVLAELESMNSIGVFLATELAHGNNVQALETEAVYDHAAREFVIHTPNVRAQKFMPNTGAEGVAKIAVVMARLKVAGKDCGVFPFIVRVRTSSGVCAGVRVTPLGEKPDYALDNAVTSFDHVRIPRSHWLSGTDSSIDEHGVFSSQVRTRGARFMRAMDRVQMGKLCLSACGVALSSAALQITFNYASQRRTFSPTGRDVSILSYRSYQRAMFESTATHYACALLLHHTRALCERASLESDIEVSRALAMCKVFVSTRSIELLSRCRERIGAQGMFSANRIISYATQMQGVVTAEGDNEILLIKTARELLVGTGYTPPAEDRETLAAGQGLQSAEFLVALVRARERSLVLRLREELRAAKHGSALEAWNEHLSDAIELAQTHAARLALECFGRAVDRIDHPDARAVLERLLRLFALQEIAKFSTALLVDGSIGPQLAADIQPQRAQLASQLYARIDDIQGAFRISTSLLAAPIGEDYLVAYDFMEGRAPVLESYINELASHEAPVACGA